MLSAFIFEASNISLPTLHNPISIVRLPTSPNKEVMFMMESTDEAPMPAFGSSSGGSGAGGSGSGGSGGRGGPNSKPNTKHPVIPVFQLGMSAPLNNEGVGTYTQGNMVDTLFGQLMSDALDAQKAQWGSSGKGLNRSRFEPSH